MNWVPLFLLLSGCGFLSMRPMAQTPIEEVRRQIHSGPAALKVGAAKVEITPPVGTPLAGYAKRRGKPSTGIRDPLFVRALAVSDEQDTAVIVSADLLAFPQPVADRILARISAETKLPRQAILLSATHTHSGSGGIGHGFLYEQVFGRYDSALVEGITGRLLWAVRQAMENRKEVQWAAAREPDFLGSILENRAVPGGPVDGSLSVVLFEGAEASPQALVVSAAAHPTLMDSKDFRFSGDFPGELCRRLETDYPGAVCLFLNGAAGDTRPVDAIGNDPEERIQRVAGAIAEGVTALIGSIELKTKGDCAVWGMPVALPPPQMRLGPIPLHPRIGRLMRPGSLFLNLVALDEWVIVPLSAEPTAEVGLKMKERLQALSLEPVLAAYSNGYIGYAVTAERYRSGSYESSMTWYGPGLADLLAEKIEQLAALYRQK